MSNSRERNNLNNSITNALFVGLYLRDRLILTSRLSRRRDTHIVVSIVPPCINIKVQLTMTRTSKRDHEREQIISNDHSSDRAGAGGRREMRFKSFPVNQRQPRCLLRMVERADAIDPRLSTERAASGRTVGTAGCADRTAVVGESLSALIAVIKFENLPDPPPTKILRLRISNRPPAYSQYCHVPKRIISRHFEELCRRAISFLEKSYTQRGISRSRNDSRLPSRFRVRQIPFYSCMLLASCSHESSIDPSLSPVFLVRLSRAFSPAICGYYIMYVRYRKRAECDRVH